MHISITQRLCNWHGDGRMFQREAPKTYPFSLSVINNPSSPVRRSYSCWVMLRVTAHQQSNSTTGDWVLSWLHYIPIVTGHSSRCCIYLWAIATLSHVSLVNIPGVRGYSREVQVKLNWWTPENPLRLETSFQTMANGHQYNPKKALNFVKN